MSRAFPRTGVSAPMNESRTYVNPIATERYRLFCRERNAGNSVSKRKTRSFHSGSGHARVKLYQVRVPSRLSPDSNNASNTDPEPRNHACALRRLCFRWDPGYCIRPFQLHCTTLFSF